jgi:MYXO-CTERM domain-containing protein
MLSRFGTARWYWTCAASENSGLGVCYAPCAAGMEACGESTRYCITAGNLCCTVPGPPWGCPAEHTCGSTNMTCLSVDEDFGCVEDCSAGNTSAAAAIVPLAGWGAIALVLFRRRRPR